MIERLHAMGRHKVAQESEKFTKCFELYLKNNIMVYIDNLISTVTFQNHPHFRIILILSTVTVQCISLMGILTISYKYDI